MRLFMSLVFIVSSISFIYPQSNPGDPMHGFQLIEKRFVKEVDADCYYFKHEKSGARLFKIANQDLNKTFCISFKTLTESDAGTPHIMEHSVLNGSKHFPVKSPFDILSKGSLNTFLNAMTGSDITLYPVSSMNDKDFQTLMHIYLDAVFNPLIYEDPRILEQEGWHHELTHVDSPVTYKGVVYNEMKGAFSSPTREWGYWVDKYLFPDTPYRFSSGGYPQAIPSLTQEDFLAFHRKYYHPSNSYIFLYGDGDLESELAFINREYLSKYQQPKERVTIPLQTAFDAPRVATGKYAATLDSETEGESYLSLSFVSGLSSDPQLAMGLRLLAQVLFNNEAAPVRIALQEAGIGKDISAWTDDLKQNVFHVRVQNANPGDGPAFQQLVMKTLERVMNEGVDPQAIAGVLNRMEFSLREGNTPQKGLYYNNKALSSWFWLDEPFSGLEYEKPLAQFKAGISNGYLEELIRDSFLENNHVLLFTLNPKPGLEGQIDEQREQELRSYKESLSDEALSGLVTHTEALIAYQKEGDSPEALASIPLLDLKDINPEVDWFEADPGKVARMPYLHFNTFTNNISYIQFFFDLRVLSQDELPYASLLSVLLGSIGTESHEFGELDNLLDAKLGGFNTYLSSYLEEQDDARLIPKFVVSTKTLSDDLSPAFELTAEILRHSLLADTARIKDVLSRHHSRLSANIKRDGLGYARTRLFSYLSNEGMFDELTGGLEYYWFINDLVEHFEDRSPALIEQLERLSDKLFQRKNLMTGVTCSEVDLPAFRKELKGFKRELGRGSVNYEVWDFEPLPKNEGLMAASKVQYVLQGADFKQLGYEWDGKIRVLNQIISREWLKNQVRVIGGAYGGFARFSPSGVVYFGSYRDPNLGSTLENYASTPAFLNSFQVDDDEMTRFIIGTISGMDRPDTPSQRGSIALSRYFQKSSKLKLQEERHAVLSTTQDDIRNYEKMVRDILANAPICVYGNENLLTEHADLFGRLVKLD